MKIDDKIQELLILAEDLGLEDKGTREARRAFYKKEIEVIKQQCKD